MEEQLELNIGEEPKIEQTPPEVKASEKGWRPKADFQGPEEVWVDADEFLRREPFFEKIKGQSKEIQTLKKTMEAMTSTFTKTVEAQVAVKLKELKAAKKEAVADGNNDLVDEIDGQIDEIKATPLPKQVPEMPNEVKSFIDRNSSWFDKDPEMTRVAIEHNKIYLANHPGDLAAAIEATEKMIKRAYPDKFENKKKEDPPSVEGGSDGAVKNVKKYTYSRLNDEQQLVYNQLVKRDKILSHEEYFKGLEENGDLK